jgi:16S rRNA (uracil1498-N3)-methyltransferase
MANPRFLVPELAPAPGAAPAASGVAVLPEAASHHARRVLRLRPGDAVTLFDGAGHEFHAVLMPADAKDETHSRARIVAAAAVDREATIAVTLVQALSAQEKIDWLVEKCVELGVRRLVLAPSERSVVRLEAARQARRLARWHEIAVSAACQCGRNRLMSIDYAPDLGGALRLALDGCERRWVLDPGAPAGIGAGLAARDLAAGVLCVVGPEGGFTEEEIALAESLGYARARLGARVLRTETAGVAVVCAVLALGGEYS